MAITEKRVSLDNIIGYKVPVPNTQNEDFPDAESYLRDTEKRNETGEGPQAPIAPPVAAKPKVVTKEQMQKAGFDNLRDYLNATNASGPLKRRGDSASPSVSSNYLDSEKGSTRGQKAPVVMVEKTTMGQRKKPYDPGSVDNSFVGSKFAKGGVTGKYMSFTKTGKPDGMKPVMAKGGVTRSSASKRADGIATKGFTKGKNL